MKFFIFGDVHEDSKIIKKAVERAKKKDIEFVICIGDFSNFGRGMTNVFSLFDKIGKPFYVIPGNHEEGRIDKVIGKYPNCTNFDRKVMRAGDHVILGYGGGGFATKDPEFRKLARQWYSKYNGKKIIFVTHGPPANTALDKMNVGHVGNVDYRKFIERVKPVLAISGHIHETAGATDQIGPTRLINCGWEGVVIEI